MRIYCDVKTKEQYTDAPFLDYITLEHPTLGTINLDWQEYDKCMDKDGLSSYRFKGVIMKTYDDNGNVHVEQGNGKLDIIKECKVYEICLVASPDNDEDHKEEKELKQGEFAFTDGTILFQDGEEEYEMDVSQYIIK